MADTTALHVLMGSHSQSDFSYRLQMAGVAILSQLIELARAGGPQMAPQSHKRKLPEPDARQQAAAALLDLSGTAQEEHSHQMASQQYCQMLQAPAAGRMGSQCSSKQARADIQQATQARKLCNQ